MIVAVIIISIALFLINKIVIRFTKYWKARKKVERDERVFSKYPKLEFIANLESKGYFKYVTQIQTISKMKTEILKNYDPEHSFYGPEGDYRFFYLDGEDSSNIGGIESDIESIMDNAAVLGLKLEINDYSDKIDSETGIRNHHITINKRKYVISDNEVGQNPWADEPLAFANILNKELELQNNDNRVYLGSGGNDGYGVFLSDELYEIMDNAFTIKYSKPLPPEMWFKVQTFTE